MGVIVIVVGMLWLPDFISMSCVVDQFIGHNIVLKRYQELCVILF